MQAGRVALVGRGRPMGDGAMKRGIVVALVSALVVGVSLGAAVAGSRVIDLDANPSPSNLAQAREAYHRGDIVRIIGGTPADLQRLLGARMADASSLDHD